MNPNQRPLRFFAATITLSILTLLIASIPARAVKYYYQDLGTLGGTHSYAYGINNSGRVVGTSNTDIYASSHAFLWTPSQGMKDLGTLVPGYGYSNGQGMNNAGQVVGISSTLGAANACLWNPGGGKIDLGSLIGEQGGSCANGINNEGIVVGETFVTILEQHAFRWTASEGMKDIGTLGGGYSIALGINDRGIVVGNSSIGSGQVDSEHAFRWTASENMKDLNGLVTLPPYVRTLVSARAINNNDTIVGAFDDTRGSTSSAFSFSSQDGFKSLWQNGSPFSVNDIGQVVGQASDSTGNVYAVVWNQDSGVQNLNDLTLNLPAGVLLDVAFGINNIGQIVGNTYNADTKETRAFLLTPQVIDVPKPTATPPIEAFIPTDKLLTNSGSFIRNHKSEFSAPTQQVFDDNLNPLERFLVKHTSGSGWKSVFEKGEIISGALGKVLSLGSIEKTNLASPPLAALELGIWSGKTALYNKLNTDWGMRAAIDSVQLLGSTAITGFNPFTFLLGANGIIYGDIVAGAFGDLANDPPDPNFQEVYQCPIASTAPYNCAGISPEMNRIFGQQIGSLYNTYYYMTGIITSVNRYGSALSAGDAISAGLQFEAFVKYLILYDAAAIQTATLVQQVKQALSSQGMPDFSYDRQSVFALQEQINLNGLPTELIDYLKNIGLTDSDISDLTQAMINYVPPDSLSGGLYSNLSTGTDLLHTASSWRPPNPALYLLLMD